MPNQWIRYWSCFSITINSYEIFKKSHKTCRLWGYTERFFNSIHNICTNFCCKHRVNEYYVYHIIQCKCVHKVETIQHTHYHLRFIFFDAKSRRRRLSWGELVSVCKKTERTKRFKYVVLYSSFVYVLTNSHNSSTI